MPWPRGLRREVEQAQIVQGRILADRAAHACAQPHRHRAAVPHVMLRRRTHERLAQLLQLVRGGQEPSGMGMPRWPVRALAMIDQGRRSLLIEAARHAADPVRRIPRQLRHPIRRIALRQQPEKVPVATLGALPSAAVAPFQLVHTEICRQLDSSWHALFYNTFTYFGISHATDRVVAACAPTTRRTGWSSG